MSQEIDFLAVQQVFKRFVSQPGVAARWTATTLRGLQTKGWKIRMCDLSAFSF